MVEYIKKLWIKVKLKFNNPIQKKEKEILNKIDICKEISIDPYTDNISVIVCTDDIIECIEIMDNYNSLNIKKDIFKPPICDNVELHMYEWFTDKTKLLNNINTTWETMLSEYSKLVKLYFKYSDSDSAMAVTNTIRINTFIFKIEKFLDSIIDIHHVHTN